MERGILQENEPLHIPESSTFSGIPCRVAADGYLVFADGYRADTPSGAAKHVMELLGKPVMGTTGWTLWQVPRLGCRLCDLKKFIQGNPDKPV